MFEKNWKSSIPSFIKPPFFDFSFAESGGFLFFGLDKRTVVANPPHSSHQALL